MNLNRGPTVLVTGGGAPGIVGTLYALRKNPDKSQVRVIACDMRDEVIGKYLADGFYKIPSAEDPDFVGALLSIAEREHVDVVLPQVTRELLPLSKERDRFQTRGIAIALATREAIQRANDKYLLVEAARSCGVPHPRSILTRSEKELVEAAKSLGYPKEKVVAKPRVSNGMRGLRIVCEELWDVQRFLTEKPDSVEIRLEELVAILRRGRWPELIVQEYLPGPEYTIDVFRGQASAVAVPRLREEIRSGITFRARIEMREDLKEFALSLAEELGLRYAFGFQFKLSKEGIPKVLECNPRVQGTMVAAVFAGCNVIWYAVKEAIGETVTVTKSMLNDGVEFIRYWGGIAIDEGRKLGSI